MAGSNGGLMLLQRGMVDLLLIGMAGVAIQVAFVAIHQYVQLRRESTEARVRHAYTDAVLELLADEATPEACAAFRAALPAQPKARDIVGRLVLSDVSSLRGNTRDNVLRMLADAGFTDRYIVQSRSRRVWKRALAAQLLGELHAQEALPALERLLRDESREVRPVAARALGKLGQPAAVDALLETLAPGALSLEVVALSILQIGPAAEPRLLRHLRDSDPQVRALSADLLGPLGRSRSARGLVPLLDDDEAFVRECAARALGRLGADEATMALVLALRDDAADVRVNAATALGQIGDERAVPALAAALCDADYAVRMATGQALSALGQPGFDALTAALTSGIPLVRSHAVGALQRSGYASQIAEQWRIGGEAERAASAAFLTALAAAGGSSTFSIAGIRPEDIETERLRLARHSAMPRTDSVTESPRPPAPIGRGIDCPIHVKFATRTAQAAADFDDVGLTVPQLHGDTSVVPERDAS